MVLGAVTGANGLHIAREIKGQTTNVPGCPSTQFQCLVRCPGYSQWASWRSTERMAGCSEGVSGPSISASAILKN